MKFIHSSVLFGNGDKVSNGILSYLIKEESTNPDIRGLINESNYATDISSANHHLGKSNAAKRAKCTMKTSQGFPKFSSNVEVRLFPFTVSNLLLY